MASHSLHHVTQELVGRDQQSCFPSEASGAERSSTVGQEGVTLADDSIFSFKKSALKWHDAQHSFDTKSRTLNAEADGLRSRVEFLNSALTVMNTVAEKQAEDHKKEISELESLLELAMTGINQLQARNKELELRTDKHEHRLTAYAARLRDSQAMLHAAVSQVEELTAENGSLVDQKAALYDTLSKTLATSGLREKDLEAEIQGLKTVLAERNAEILAARKELQVVREDTEARIKTADVAWVKKHSEVMSQFEHKLGFMRSERARFRLEAREHKHNAIYAETQKDAAEAALAVCEAEMQVTSLKLKDAEQDLKHAKAQVEAAQKGEQARDRQILHLESLLPIESKGAKRLMSLGDKLDKAMSKAQHARSPMLEDITNRRRKPIAPLQLPGKVSAACTRSQCTVPESRAATINIPSLQGAFYDPVPLANIPVPMWSDESSMSFVKMHASNLVDVSEGELLFGGMRTAANPTDKALFQAQRCAPQSKGALLNRAPRGAARRRL